MIVAAASARTGDLPLFAKPGAGPRMTDVAAAGGVAILLRALWPILALGTLAVPPFLLLTIAFAGGFLVFAVRNRLCGRGAGDLFAAPPDIAGLLGLVGSQLLWLLALRLVFPLDAAAASAPWPVLDAAFAGLVGQPLVGQPPSGAAAGAALGCLLAGCGMLCWVASATARRRRAAGAPDPLGALCGTAVPICLLLHLCLEPRLPLDAASLLAAAAIGLGPLGMAAALRDRPARAGDGGRLSAARRRAAGGR